ncbi:MAG: O-antigen polymerase [Candidatus Thiodiazotropha sp.]
MLFAIIAWTVGAFILVFMLRWFVKRKNITAVAVLIVLASQVFVRPVIFFAGLDEPFPHEFFGGYDWHLIAMGILLATAWIVIFSITHILIYRPLTPFTPLLPQVNVQINTKILFFVALFTTLLGVVLTTALILNAGSVGNFIFQVKVEKALRGTYLIRTISVLGAIFSILSILYYEKKVRTTNKKLRRMVYLSAILFIINLTFNYLWGNRYNIAMLSFALGIGWHYLIQRISVLRVIVLVLIAAAILQALKTFRTEAVYDALDVDIQSTRSFWLDISTSLHLSQFDAFILAFRDAGDRFPFREGKDFINGLLAWVPRELYPEKETYHVGGWFRRVYQPKMVNGWPITTIGSWYVNFGIFGIVFGGIVSGIFASLFDASYRSVTKSYWQAAIAPSMALLLFDGGVGTGFFQDIVLIMIPIYLLSFILNKTGRKISSSPVSAYQQ